MDSPFFSIVVPAYNTAPYLPRCIGSLLDQPFRDFEILLVDDGSTDDTGTVIDTLAAKDHRVRGFHIPHGGVSAARNQGLRMAKGSYVLFVDSDDALVPDALGHIYRNLGDAPDMLCFGLLTRSVTETEQAGQYDCGETGFRYKSISETADDCIRRNTGFISACTHSYRLPVIREHHIFFQDRLAFGEDRLFNWNFLRHCRGIVYIKNKLYIYSCDRKGSGSHRFVPGMSQILIMLQEENVSTMLALCSASVTEMEKSRFRSNCFFSTTREAWKHLALYYTTLSKEQRAQELNHFLSICTPEHPCVEGLRFKRRLWTVGLRWIGKLRAGWLLKPLLYAESIYFRWKMK